MVTFEYTQRYKIDDNESKRWAMQVARQQVVKQLVAQASAHWRYLMTFEEIHTTDGTYTFRITLDEQAL